MKIRTGFVSNSSSSSFCLYGVSVDEYRDELLTKIYNDYNEKHDTDYDPEEGELGFYELEDRIVSIDGPDDYEVIGVSPESLRSNFPDAKFSETLDIAAREISRVLGKEVQPKDIGYHEDGWYNG